MSETTPTTELWSAYQAMFDYFNAELWGGKLPQVILNFSRKRGALGFFWAERWAPVQGAEAWRKRVGGRCQRPQRVEPERPERVHEISLNPDHSNRTPEAIASTLVHEMAHHWQEVFGTPGKGGYHNKQWGTEMKRVGLQPVSYDKPGTEVGCRVSHTVIAEGAFEKAFASLPVRAMPWAVGAPQVNVVAPPPGRRGNRNKVKYSCPCGQNVWGKPGMVIRCQDCLEDFTEVEA